MIKDTAISREQLLGEVQALRKKLSDFERLEGKLLSARQEVAALKQRIKNQAIEFVNEQAARSKMERELRLSQLIVERSPVILFRRTGGDRPTLEYISDNICQFGYLPEEFYSGKKLFKDLVHPEDLKRLKKENGVFSKENIGDYSQQYRMITSSGEIRWVEGQTSVVQREESDDTHMQGIIIDITEKKLAENALQKSEQKFRRIVETTSESFLLMDENLRIKEVNAAFSELVGYGIEELKGMKPYDLTTESFKQYMLANEDTILSQERRKFEGVLVAKDGRQIPILAHGNTLRDDRGKVIGNIAFVSDLTEQKRALFLAREVQKSLLPQDKPKVAGLDVAGRNISCDEIGGDYFDYFFRGSPGKEVFNVVVGDISGHGVDSALLMTSARAFLRMRASHPGSLSEIVTDMNSHLVNDLIETGRFMTLIYLSIDPEKRLVEWVRAGHEPAYTYDLEEDRFEELKGKGIAIGIDNDFIYENNIRKKLTEGQIIILGTDGAWEALNLEGEMFGKERVQELVRSMAKYGANAEEILESIYSELDRFTQGCKRDDDITLVIIKVEGD